MKQMQMIKFRWNASKDVLFTRGVLLTHFSLKSTVCVYILYIVASSEDVAQRCALYSLQATVGILP